MEPARDILPGADRHIYATNSAPLINLDTPGIWKFDNDFVPKTPVVFFNLYNNQWNTNYRYWYTGSWTTRVRLWTFGKVSLETTLIRPSLKTRNPLLSAVADGRGGKLPVEQTGLSVSRSGILLTAFGKDPDGGGILLRLWEMGGNSRLCKIALPDGINVGSLQPVDLRGRSAGEKIKVTKNQFEVDAKAFAPMIFVIE